LHLEVVVNQHQKTVWAQWQRFVVVWSDIVHLPILQNVFGAPSQGCGGQDNESKVAAEAFDLITRLPGQHLLQRGCLLPDTGLKCLLVARELNMAIFFLDGQRARLAARYKTVQKED
jgi:hypothetical protein